jgi:hypothetical protein
MATHIAFRARNEQLFFLALAAVSAVAAVATAPMWLLSAFLWLVTVGLVALALFWERLRWECPLFMPPSIATQIRKGIDLRLSLGQAGNFSGWEAETLSEIDREWGKSSFQYQRFLHFTEMAYPDPLIKLDWGLDCLKALPTAWFGPPEWQR